MNNEQEIAGRIYRDGCYALCLCKMGAKLLELEGISPLSQLALEYDFLVKSGIMMENCYINDAARFLQDIYPGRRFRVTKTTTNPGDGWVIATNSKHFVCVNDAGEIVYNPLGEVQNKEWYKLPVHSFRKIELV